MKGVKLIHVWIYEPYFLKQCVRSLHSDPSHLLRFYKAFFSQNLKHFVDMTWSILSTSLWAKWKLETTALLLQGSKMWPRGPGGACRYALPRCLCWGDSAFMFSNHKLVMLTCIMGVGIMSQSALFTKPVNKHLWSQDNRANLWSRADYEQSKFPFFLKEICGCI